MMKRKKCLGCAVIDKIIGCGARISQDKQKYIFIEDDNLYIPMIVSPLDEDENEEVIQFYFEVELGEVINLTGLVDKSTLEVKQIYR